MKKYRVSKYGIEVEEIEVTRETEHTVVLAGQHESREAKVSSYCRYYDTWDEARDALLVRATARLVNARAEVDRLMVERDVILDLKP